MKQQITVVFSCKLPSGIQKNASTTPFAVKNGKTLSEYDSCRVYKDYNSSLETIGCLNGWTFKTQPKESSIITEVSFSVYLSFSVSTGDTFVDTVGSFAT